MGRLEHAALLALAVCVLVGQQGALGHRGIGQRDVVCQVEDAAEIAHALFHAVWRIERRGFNPAAFLHAFLYDEGEQTRSEFAGIAAFAMDFSGLADALGFVGRRI